MVTEQQLLNQTGDRSYDDADVGEMTIVTTTKRIGSIPKDSWVVGTKSDRELDTIVEKDCIWIPAEYFGREDGSIAAAFILPIPEER